MAWPDEQPCDSLQTLLKSLEELTLEARRSGHRWIYRGQARGNWGLEPTIERRRPNVSSRDSEGRLLWDFKKLAAALAPRLPDFADTPSWLALMRHYGVPTRVLDWTDSSSVALFFACDGYGRQYDDADRTSSLWAVNASLVVEKMEAQIASLVYGSALWASLDLSSPEQFDAVALYTFDDPVKKEEGLIAELPLRWANSRLAFQQGTLLINCNHQLPFAESLKRMMQSVSASEQPWVRKFTFPWIVREDIWDYLFRINVHPFTLFPDLDGLGQLLNLKNHLYWSSPKPK